MISEKQRFRLPILLDIKNLRSTGFAFTTMFILLLCIYANSFNGTWQYDDYLNILDNTNIQLEEFSWENLGRILNGVSQHSATISRPISYLSFAINYYLHKYNVLGYHIFNFAVHFAASLFLYLLIVTVLRLPACKNRFDHSAEAVALLSLCFWAPHPIHVTAVTYIVQRMASLAGMFYIAAIYFYVKARITSVGYKRYIWGGLVCLSAILAFGSKENAVMLPISIFLLDVMVLQFPAKFWTKRNAAVAVLLTTTIFTASLYYIDWTRILSSFDFRPFSLWQRLLTEPRVIIFYLSLLFYPTTDRLMLLHDITVSTGLFAPWQTTPAIFLIVVLIAGMILWRRKYPFLAYCVIFFFLNHLIEGSVISLELMYEHRNYLPSMLIFVPLAAFIVKSLDFFAYRATFQGLIAFCTVFVLCAHAHTTHLYNEIFLDELSLWEDNVEKSPNLSITHNNFGQALRMSGRLERAEAEFTAALKLNRYHNARQRGVVLYNMGLHSAYEEKSYDQALELFRQALRYLPSHPDLIRHTALVALLLGRAAEAEQLLQRGLIPWQRDPGLLQAMATLRLLQNRFTESFHLASRAYQIAPQQSLPLIIMATACKKKGDILLSLAYWEKAISKNPTDPLCAFSLAQIYHDLQRINERDRYIGLLRYLKKKKKWQAYWNSIQEKEINRFFIPAWHEILSIVGHFPQG